MENNSFFDVIVVGGSYAGLAAAMALGRALKTVLVIDSGLPCNRQTPRSHNFLTRDGSAPSEIASVALEQVRRYDTVHFLADLALEGRKVSDGFEIITASGLSFMGSRLVFATGIWDLLPDIRGISECWGISVLHCPFCHGYEVRNEQTAVIGNGAPAHGLASLISNWSRDLTVFTNGPSTLPPGDFEVVDKEIGCLVHKEGRVEEVIFKDLSEAPVRAIYIRPPFEQHCNIPETLGCVLTDEGYLKVDGSLETTVPGVYACGDNASRMRTVANAVAMGTAVGITISREMILHI